ncbi:CobW family GTP-binding protein [Rhodocyclus tenuis]|uniref:G3E family GTPase n=1 Tax=Rhodocyclus tenuis TaxID=1066 RepID=A0A840G0J5_RHOTE|nr:GTP-binding protein [Rhodocyclus tenuis]MBB4245993.1 G3E family GTPase [Rhodocyclus tenuis]
MATVTDPARTLSLTVVTGFLGAGKTTLVNALLRDARLADTAVLINEFGSVGIDHHLVEKIDDNVVLLASGCLCCSARGDLARALRDLFMRRLRREIPPFSRVLVETTGLADPAPVLATISGDFFLAERYRIDGVVTVIDATLGEGQLARHVEAVKQAAMADRLLLAKCDLAPRAQIDALRARLDRLNPGAPLREMAHGEVDAGFVFGLAGGSERRGDELACWLAAAEERAAAGLRAAAAAERRRLSPADPAAADRLATAAAAEGDALPLYRSRFEPGQPVHDAAVHTFVLRFAEPFVWPEFSEAIDVLLATCGARILRIKGLVNVVGESRPRVLHCVQHLRYPLTTLPAWPAEAAPVASPAKLAAAAAARAACQDSRLVFIVDGLSREVVAKAFTMFCGGVEALPAAA